MSSPAGRKGRSRGRSETISTLCHHSTSEAYALGTGGQSSEAEGQFGGHRMSSLVQQATRVAGEIGTGVKHGWVASQEIWGRLTLKFPTRAQQPVFVCSSSA